MKTKPSLPARIWSRLRRMLFQRKFVGSSSYWEERYRTGGNSGVGSHGKFADFKAEFLNGFVRRNQIQSVIEFGSGDGNQLTLADYPHYIGIDVSGTAIQRCRELFRSDPSKTFQHASESTGATAELGLSLDVIYHLVEDEVFERYMKELFRAATRFVVIYSSDHDDSVAYRGTHVRLRAFSQWVSLNEPKWELVERIPNRYPYRGDYEEGSWSDFFVYRRRTRET